MKVEMRLAFCLPFLLCGLWVDAQHKLTGTLIDFRNERPLVDAVIFIVQTSNQKIICTDVTDLSGRFQLNNIPSGNYFIKSHYVGIDDSLNQSIQITRDTVVQLTIGKQCRFDETREYTNCPTCGKEDNVISVVGHSLITWKEGALKKITRHENAFQVKSTKEEFIIYGKSGTVCMPRKYCKRDKTFF